VACSGTTLALAIHNTISSRYTRFRDSCFRISAALFQYPEEHPYPIRGQILKPVNCVERDADDEFNYREFCHQFNIKGQLLRFPFYALSVHAAISRKATVYNKNHWYSTGVHV
jgi:hypothetical protein